MTREELIEKNILLLQSKDKETSDLALKALFPKGNLNEDEFFIKISEDLYKTKSAFLAKLTKKGEFPKAFLEWGYNYETSIDAKIQIHIETFRKGWTIQGKRYGVSQNWAKVSSPEGWVVEIYLDHFLDLLKNNTIINGELQGEFKWRGNSLIKNEI